MILRRQFVWLFVAVGLFVNGCSRTSTTEIGLPDVDDRIAITAVPVERSRITATLDTVDTLLPVRSTTWPANGAAKNTIGIIRMFVSAISIPLFCVGSSSITRFIIVIGPTPIKADQRIKPM